MGSHRSQKEVRYRATPPECESESTIKVPRNAMRAVALAELQATLPPVAPATGMRPIVVPDRAERRDTPHTIVLPDDPHPDRATLTMLAGPDAGASFAVSTAEITLGRSRSSTIPIDELSVSRHHARILREGEGRYCIEDLGSTNGTFVSGRRVKQSPLRSGDRIQIGREAVLRFAMVDEIEETMQRRLYETASRDTLTGLLNRRTLFERLAAEIAHSTESGEDLGLLMIDVDHFKRVNDTFGHVAGDQALRAVALSGAQALRAGDHFARYGGEEMAVVARGADRTSATALAERFRRIIADVRVEVGGGAVGMTVSVGVAVLSECTRWTNGLDLVALADERLYQAKQSGRNRVCAGP
jgi:diguanylate cyclase (GGDEF)-like protein